MSERPKPYVGVSGVVCQKDVQPSGLVVTKPQQLFLEAIAQDAGLFDTDRLLMLGVKAIYQTQWEDKPFVRGDVSYGSEWYPVGEGEFGVALRSDRHHPQTLHTAQMYIPPTEMNNFHNFMNRIHWRGRGWIQAVQYDMLPWHEDPQLLEKVDVTRRYFQTQSIVQSHDRAMTALGPQGVAKTLGKYASGLDYVLFDASHGTGKTLNADALEPFLDEVYSSEKLKHVGFGVAGGLDGPTIHEQMPALLQKYPDLSWDAEGKLHPLNNIGTRPLQMDETEGYLYAAVDVINQAGK